MQEELKRWKRTRPNIAEGKNISKVGYCPNPHPLILARQEQTKKEQVRTD